MFFLDPLHCRAREGEREELTIAPPLQQITVERTAGLTGDSRAIVTIDLSGSENR